MFLGKYELRLPGTVSGYIQAMYKINRASLNQEVTVADRGACIRIQIPEINAGTGKTLLFPQFFGIIIVKNNKSSGHLIGTKHFDQIS